MPYKNIEERRKHYEKNKDEINRKRREYGKSPEVKERKKKVEKKWRIDNKEKITKYNVKFGKRYRTKLKLMAFNHYGNSCACCGEKEKAFLTIDHINGGGTKHRKKINESINKWLYKNNYPRGFHTLCFNCNWGKYYNNGICPHQDKKFFKRHL